jgi:hypothetical protein
MFFRSWSSLFPWVSRQDYTLERNRYANTNRHFTYSVLFFASFSRGKDYGISRVFEGRMFYVDSVIGAHIVMYRHAVSVCSGANPTHGIGGGYSNDLIFSISDRGTQGLSLF